MNSQHYFRFASLARSVTYKIGGEGPDPAVEPDRLAPWVFEQTPQTKFVSRANMRDFCASLAAYLLTPHDECVQEALFATLRLLWPHPTSQRRLLFLSCLRRTPQYGWYSLEEERVLRGRESSRVEDQHRLKKIPEWSDGSQSAMTQLLTTPFTTLLQKYQIGLDVHRFFREKGVQTDDPEAELNIPAETRTQYQAVAEVLQAWRNLEFASKAVRRYRRSSSQGLAASA